MGKDSKANNTHTTYSSLARCVVMNRVVVNKSIQPKVRNYSTTPAFSQLNLGLNPWFITGFTDGEGSFIILILKNPKLKSGWECRVCFQIGLDVKDKGLLDRIQAFFGGVGKVHKGEKNIYRYMVHKPKELMILVDHFDKYPLITQKRADFELFKKAVEILCNKEHLTIEGVHKLVAIKASINLGLSSELKEAFSYISNFPRPNINDQAIKRPYWLSGFTTAEGCFLISLKKKSTEGYYVSLRFQISQHSRDELLMKSLVSYLECGLYEKREGDWGNFVCSNIKDITDKIIPFFNLYSLEGLKLLNYMDWYEAAELIKTKAHLTTMGLDKILKIKASMNTKRD